MVRMKDIAAEAGVSRGTVDRVLHKRGKVAKDKEKLILDIARKMGYEPNIAAMGLAARKKDYKLGFIYIDDDFSPLQKIIAAEAREYAKELIPYGVEVYFIPFAGKRPHKENAEKMVWDILKGYDVDGYALIGPLAQDVEMVLKKHGKPEVPIVVYNVEGDCDWKVCYVGCDFEEAGRLACGLAALMTNQQGKICILSIDYTDIPSSVLRIRGFESEKEKYMDMQVVSKFETIYDEDFELFAREFDEYLLSEKNIDIIYFIYAGDDKRSQIIADIGKKHHIRIITSDLVTEKQKQLFQENQFAAMISQEPKEQGRKALEILFNQVVLGKTLGVDWHKTGLSIRIKQNMEY